MAEQRIWLVCVCVLMHVYEYMCAVTAEVRGRVFCGCAMWRALSFPYDNVVSDPGPLSPEHPEVLGDIFHTHQDPQLHPLLKIWQICPGSQAAGVKPRLQPQRMIGVILELLWAMQDMVQAGGWY